MHFKAGALYYVIFVVFVLCAITSLYALYRGMRVRHIDQELAYYTCQDDLNSALILYLSDPDNYQKGKPVNIRLFEDTSRLVQISVMPYGLLDLVTAETNYRGKRLSKTLLAGKDPYRSDSVALYVPDNNQSLYASGDTRIVGNAVIPAKGVQRASIEGKPLREDQPISGKINQSGDSLPPLSSSVIAKLRQVQNLDSICAQAIPITELYQASVTNPLLSDILWYGTKEDYQISGFEAIGAVGFCSTGTIIIRKDARLQGTLVTASRIIVEDGFVGNVQLFAFDSLSIGKDCNLRFPSLACLNSNQAHNLYVEIGLNSHIEGTLLVHQNQLSAKEPFLKIDEGAVITGQVYHQGQVNLLGSIYGSLYCESFYLNTDRAYYENHLLDNEIDFMKLSPLFVSVDLIYGYHDQIIDFVDQAL